MRAAVGKVVIVLVAAALLANPKRPPLKVCGSCSTSNEPDRTTCIGCGVKF